MVSSHTRCIWLILTMWMTSLCLYILGVVPCGHAFEHESLIQHQKHQGRKGKCPKCRGPIQSVMRLPDIKQLIRDTVKVRCPMEKCKSSVKIDELESHLMNTCKHVR